tara:strand:- start:1590 stop:1898 length:309 start_codon:yes stop_codon:yes gene_type:complete
MSDYDNGPRIDFALFKNKFAKTDKHPKETGKIEITREFLKALVAVAKTGVLPEIKAAAWDNVSKNGLAYKSIRLEITTPEPVSETPEPEEVATASSSDDMPW